MTFDLSIIFDIPEFQYLRCVASNVNVAYAFKIRNHRALRCKQRNIAFAFKIRNHRALRCFLDSSNYQIVVSTQDTEGQTTTRRGMIYIMRNVLS